MKTLAWHLTLKMTFLIIYALSNDKFDGLFFSVTRNEAEW